VTDYIKVPTLPTQDLLRGVEAVSPSLRINSQQPRQGYAKQQSDNEIEKEIRDPRRFLKLRDLIRELQGRAKINRVDFVTADAELRGLGLAIVEEKLIPGLLQLKIPLESIESLFQQMDKSPSSIRLARDRRIVSTEPTLFPISTEGLLEYNLIIGDLSIHSGKFGQKIVEAVVQDGISTHQHDRLRLTFSRIGSTFDVTNALLKLQISVLLGVAESDEFERRAILYPQTDSSYGLYADKCINLSI